MKKKLALLLAGVMVAAMVPVTAFASTQNRLIDSVKTVKKDTTTISTIAIRNDKQDLDGQAIVLELNLNNAKWATNTAADVVPSYVAPAVAGASGGAVFAPVTETSGTVTIPADVFPVAGALNGELKLAFATKVIADGEASITINPVSGPVSGGTYTYAIAASGGTVTAIEKTVALSESGVAIKPITITETAPGVLSAPGTITFKISKNFKFTGGPAVVSKSYGDGAITTPGTIAADGSTVTYAVTGASTVISKYAFTGLSVVAKDSAKNGDVCEITISGADMTKQTVEVGTYTEYGYTFVVEDKDLPVLYSGTWDDNETLKVTFKETVEGSWMSTRKTVFTFPDGVKVLGVDTKTVSNVAGVAGSSSYDLVTPGAFTFDKNKVSLSNVVLPGAGNKAELQMKFVLSVAPDFTGDITVSCGGSAVDEDTELTVATAEMPFTIEADINEVNIDYRNVAVGDITIKEAYEGALEDGLVLSLQVENMNFEKGFTWEVTEGDLDIDSVRVNGGFIDITVKSASAKTPGTLVISDLSLYLNRSLPAGDYALLVIENGNGVAAGAATTPGDSAFFRTFADPVPTVVVGGLGNASFNTDEVIAQDAYVRVVTAGREQDDSTFTTQIVVPIGAYEIKAGTKTVALDTPAYINEAGYTMMPLRGVVEALSGSAIISWDDATKTVTILFGSRVISMTIGTKSMVINGTAVAMTSAPVIVNSRTFLPLRDLGYALGLADSKISWDDTTKTATLN